MDEIAQLSLTNFEALENEQNKIFKMYEDGLITRGQIINMLIGELLIAADKLAVQK